jgi:hypothetical protein
MNSKKIKRICAVDSMYTLLQYLLLSSIEEIESTYFFWRKGVSEEVKSFFSKQSATVPSNFPFFQRLLWYYVIVPLKWPFVLKNNIDRFACDNLGFEFLFVRRKDFTLLEDGLLSYVPYAYKWKRKRFVKLKKLLFGPLFVPKTRVGDSETCKRIMLTGLKPAPIMNDPRTIVNSLISLWESSSIAKQSYIKNILGISNLNLESIKECDAVLLTQPFSEDKEITENEKIELYKKMMANIGDSVKVVIKPHPREITDYHKIFPNKICLRTKVPMQMLSFCGVRFKDVYTVCSTAAFDFPYRVRVFYTGNDVSPKLMKSSPNCSLSELGEIPENVDFVAWKLD